MQTNLQHYFCNFVNVQHYFLSATVGVHVALEVDLPSTLLYLLTVHLLFSSGIGSCILHTNALSNPSRLKLFSRWAPGIIPFLPCQFDKNLFPQVLISPSYHTVRSSLALTNHWLNKWPTQKCQDFFRVYLTVVAPSDGAQTTWWTA